MIMCLHVYCMPTIESFVLRNKNRCVKLFRYSPRVSEQMSSCAHVWKDLQKSESYICTHSLSCYPHSFHTAYQLLIYLYLFLFLPRNFRQLIQNRELGSLPSCGRETSERYFFLRGGQELGGAINTNMKIYLLRDRSYCK